MAKPPGYRIYASKRGNVFMAELAHLLRRVLTDLGRTATVLDSGLPEAQENWLNVIVAPHEFFHFAKVDGASDDRIAEAASHSICVTTEQMGTPWFDLQTRLCSSSRLILDINRTAAGALRRMGHSAEHLQLGYHSSIDHWNGPSAASGERACDVTVLAALTPRRDRFLAHAATLLWDRVCDIRVFTFEQPISGAQPGFLVGAQKLDHLASSKLLLNVHRSDFGYFEWLRIVEAVANGCVLVTEESTGYQPFVPFEHFVQSPLNTLAEYALALLLDDTWRNQLATAAYGFLRDKLDMVRIVRDLLPMMEELPPFLAARNPRPDVKAGAPSDGPSPAPSRPALQQHDHLSESVTKSEQGMLHATGALLALQRTEPRQTQEIRSPLDSGRSPFIETENTPSYSLIVPDVSVVLTNCDHADLVGRAIDSVIASIDVIPELIIIDDNSVDSSVSVIRDLMATKPWFPTLLVTNQTKLGLSNSRNAGFLLARADLIFVLDAEDVVYPTGIRNLAQTLASHGEGYAMAYGIIDCFTDSANMEPIGLVSCLPWNPYRLTRTHYIDAMALIRRSAWESVGGYDWFMDQHFGRWEDLDLWLRFASRGYSAANVTTPIARHQVDRISMQDAFGWVSSEAVGEFRRRYPGLPWPFPEPLGAFPEAVSNTDRL